MLSSTKRSAIVFLMAAAILAPAVQGSTPAKAAPVPADRAALDSIVSSQVASILPPQNPSYRNRIDAHMFTDKVVYRPNDEIFAEVIVVDAFNMTPVAMSPME